MANTKADALLKAAQSGMVAKIRELLAAGAPIEATDVNRMTPVMLAAQGGHVEAFRVLVEAGADLHALAFRQVDLLEMAAQPRCTGPLRTATRPPRRSCWPRGPM